MIEINGAEKSGSGTILRMSVALAAIRNEPLHIINIRHNRPQPGLKPQHLEAVLTAARLCDAEIKGVELGSKEIWFKPKDVKSGAFEAEIGTAGSIPMLLLTILPICISAQALVTLNIKNGGTDVSFSPTINYMRFVLIPLLKRMQINIDLEIRKYGYYPKGMGEVTATVQPTPLHPINLESFGKIKEIRGISVCTFLSDRNVAERQARAAREHLANKGFTSQIRVVNDESNRLQKGSSIVLWVETDKGAILGSDAIGELHKTSETVGNEAAIKLEAEITKEPTVDVHMADLLIPYIALAQGRSSFLTREYTEHLESNIWLAETILKSKVTVSRKNSLFRVQKE